MSLISTQNLVAPLTNKVHLTTIILVAVAFAVLRLSGGAISAVSANRAPVEANRDLQPTVVEAPAARTPARERPGVEPWERKKSQPENSKGLNDIEKMLGM